MPNKIFVSKHFSYDEQTMDLRPLLLLMAIIYSGSALIILEPMYLALNSPHSVSTGAASFNVSAQIVTPAPLDGCQPITNAEEVAGNIVLISGEECSLEVKARHAQAAGAVGVVQHEVLAVVPGLNYAFYIDPDRADITVPIVFLSGADGDTLLALIHNTTAVSVLMQSGEANEWHTQAISVQELCFSVLHGLAALLLVLCAVYKEVRYYMTRHTLLSVAQLSMALLLLSALCVLIHIVVTQLVSHGYLQALSAVLYLGLILIAWTMLMLSSLVISFYWFDITAHLTAVAKAWSHRLWRPFLIAGSVLACALVVILLWIRYFRTVAVLYAMLAVFAIITLAVAVLWLVFGLKLRHSLRTQPGHTGTRSRYHRLCRRIVASACLLVVVFITVTAGSWAGTTPIALFVVLKIAGSALEVAIAIQIMMFSTKKKSARSVNMTTE